MTRCASAETPLGGKDEDERAEAIADLRVVQSRVDSWPLDDESFATAANGLRRIYRDGRRAQHAAIAADDPEAWHEWRKRVKDLWYAARILKPAAPLELGAVVDEADGLAELLGDHNDLAVLRDALDEHARATTDHQAEQLRTAIDEAAFDLRRHAVPLGLRLYAEPPKRFVARVAAYMEYAARPARRRHAIDHPLHRDTRTRAADSEIKRRPARPRPHRARAARPRLPRLRRRQARRRLARRLDAGDLDRLIADGALRVH